MDIESDLEGIILQVQDLLLDLLSDSPTLRALIIDKVKPKALKKINSKGPKVFQVSDIVVYSNKYIFFIFVC